jgi:UDP-glucose 4-epimerase
MIDIKKNNETKTLVKNGANFIESNLNYADVKKLEKYKFEKIFHLAAIKRHNENVDPEHLFFSNLTTTANIAQLAIKTNARMIFTSSLYTYGDYSKKSKESDSPKPITRYGCSKLMAENYLNMLMLTESLNCGIARLYFAVGHEDPSGTYANVIHKFKEKVTKNSPMEVFGTGNARLNYVWITDLLDCLIKFGDTNHNKTLNVANLQDISVLEIAEEIKRKTGGVILHTKPDWTDNTIRSGTYSEAQELLGWTASVNPKEIVRNVLKGVEIS